MRNIKLTIEYDGSRYQGWVRLGKKRVHHTISNKILEVIRKMTGEDVELFCGAAQRWVSTPTPRPPALRQTRT